MTFPPRYRVLMILFHFALMSVAHAQSTNQTQSVKAPSRSQNRSLNEIVVSATHFSEESWKSGSSISVVSDATIQFQRRFETVMTMMGEPGLTVNNSAGFTGGTSQVSIRGMPFSRTLVQVDGLRFNRPVDGIANLTDVPPMLTGNIELLRGPQSSLYGSDAEGGVVSLNAPAGHGHPSFGASFEAGSFQTRRERIFSQGKTGSFDWNGEAWRLDTDNARPNSGFRQDAAALKLGYDVSEIARLEVTSRFTDYTTGSVGALQGFGANDPDDRFMRRMILVTPSITIKPLELWETKLTLGYIGIGQRSDSVPASSGGQYVNHSESLQLHFQNTIHVTDWNTLVLGGEERGEHTTTEASSGNNVFNRSTQSAYLSDSIRLVDGWGITLSGRYDDNEGFRDAFTYRASQVFTAPMTKTRLHMSYGTAFRAPTISELRNLFGPNSGANANLVPERSEGYDVGVTQPLLDGALEIDTTYFYNNIVNLISSSSPTFVFQNASEVRTEGVENSVQWQIDRALRVRASFTMTDTTNKDRRFSGLDLARIPRQSASFTAAWTPIDLVETSVVWNYGGVAFDDSNNSREINPYHRLDLFASWKPTSWLQIFGRGENLIGYRYQQANHFPANGRAFYGGVEFKY